MSDDRQLPPAGTVRCGGEEQRNADVLLEMGAAVKINDLPLLSTRVDDILTGTKRAEMAAAIGSGSLGDAEAAFIVADAVLQRRIRAESRPKAD